MAWGISPRKVIIIPLGSYSASHYLTLLYHAFNNLGWRIGYFDRDGIIGYTPISWESYAEEVSARIVGNTVVIKSECVGYQMLFTDYGKNAKNLELLLDGEIEYVEYHLKDSLPETTQQLIDTIPDSQFISLTNPPMGYKEKLRDFIDAFSVRPEYAVTPVLVLINILTFFISRVVMIIVFVAKAVYAAKHHLAQPGNLFNYVFGGTERFYLNVGFSSRNPVLSGQVWRLVTSIFSHFSLVHLAGNMVVLIYIGSLIEVKLGKWNFLLLYLLTGICAGITSVIWHAEGVAAGASGAIFGLFGILLALLSTRFYEASARRALLISTVIFVAYSIIPIGKEVDHAAHFGGLVSGYLFGWLAYLGMKNKKQNVLTIAAAAVTVIYTGCCLAFAPIYQFKESRKLTHETERLSDAITHDLYRHDNIGHDTVMMTLNQKTLPEIDSLKGMAKQFHYLILPRNRKEVAEIKAELILQECKLFTLLYKEYRDRDQVKYRPEINSTTQTINDLRVKWTDTGKDTDTDDSDSGDE